MIAVSFYDSLAGDGAAAPIDPRRLDDFLLLAGRYVESALADWERVLECEAQFGCIAFETATDRSRVNRSLYQLYQDWAKEAEQVLIRTRQLTHAGHAVANAEALEDAFGRVRGRLNMTPEMFDRAREQIRQGQGIPMPERANGLRARVRA